MMRVLLFLSSFIIAVGAVGALYITVFANQFEVDAVRAWLGSGGAAYRTALAYEHGTNVEADPAKARKWYKAASARGSVNGTLSLALMNLTGTGGPRDEARAVALFRQAAENGSVQAYMNLARCAFLGLGMKKDEAQGAQWVQEAANAGSPGAMGLMGVLYLGGIGVEQRFSKAVEWLNKSQDPLARELADRLNLFGRAINDLPPDQRDEKWREAYGQAEADLRATFNEILKKEFRPAPPQ